MIKHIPWITVLFLFCLLVAIKRTEASERHDHQTIKTEYIYLSKDNESAKYVIGGAILTCAIISAWHGRWCWQEKPVIEPDNGILTITP